MSRWWITVVAVALMGGGCTTLAPESGGRPSPLSSTPRASITCADVSYSATTADANTSRQIAEAAVIDRLRDARGDMLTAGFKKLRSERPTTRCDMTGGFGGEVHCKATASVCGR
jgi:hypothetical protein